MKQINPVINRPMTETERAHYGQSVQVAKPKKVEVELKEPTVLRATEVQIDKIKELTGALKIRPACSKGCLDWWSFEDAHRMIEWYSDKVREMRRTHGRLWSEEEVRSRLERYHEDDSMYYAKIPQLKQVVTFGSSGVNTADNRLIKRADLDRGIKGALLTKEVDRAEQIRRYKIYLAIKVIYLDRSVGFLDAAIVFNASTRTINRMVSKAVSLITGYLNKNSLIG